MQNDGAAAEEEQGTLQRRTLQERSKQYYEVVLIKLFRMLSVITIFMKMKSNVMALLYVCHVALST